MASTISVSNETNASVSRTTRDGRKLTYEMTVLQQPQRARACGSGAKSSADRRPVDPPPVVELKIFEGENRKDITFQHNATFFLFTTLEPARPLATPRGCVSAPHPVLTGMPVAGMAYLDRPTQAGYFIFPDLSVRHEGKFRLSFNLYEETKESKDGDMDAPATSAPGGQQMSFRGEVKSMPFTVYSAKKFPGLAESTSLSRLVAEQGCRVRIRRDVRMRRRDAKSGGKDYDGNSEEEYPGYQRNDRYNTPDSYNHHHERPASANEARPSAPERRPSSRDTAGYYQPPPPPQQAQQQAPLPPSQYAHSHAPPPPPSTSQSGSYSHLQFGSQPASYPQQPSGSYPGSTSSYYSHPAPQHRPTSSSGSAYNYPPRPSAYPAPPSRPSSYHDSEPNRSRAPSSATYPAFEYPAVDQQYSGSTYPSTSAPAGPTQLPPLKTLTESKYEQTSTPSVSSPAAYDSYGLLPTPTTSVTSAGPANSKRAYGRTFDDGHGHSLGLHNGARPDAVGQDHVQVECEDGTLQSQEELELDVRMLSYRRADGSRQHKRVPQAYV